MSFTDFLTVYIVWAMSLNTKSKSQVMTFHLRPELVTLDRRYAVNFARGLGATTIQEVQIPKPKGWVDDRDEF